MTKFITKEFNEVNDKIEKAIDHFILPEHIDNPESRAGMRSWVIAHVERGAIDLDEPDFLSKPDYSNEVI